MDIRTLKEFNELEHSSVHDYFKGELTKLYNTLIAAQEETTFRQAQGKAQMLQHLLTLIEKAPEEESKREGMVKGAGSEPKVKREPPKDNLLDRIDNAGQKNSHFI